ncbi:MAG: periplasmic heavy metal sensor [Pseudomonadota bacterium]
MSRGLIIGLIASAALNLLLIGVLIGGKLRDAPEPPFNPAFSIGHVVRSLDPERRETLLPVVRANYRELRPHVRALRKQQRRFAEALSAKDVDAEEVEALYAEMQRHLNEIQRIGNRSLSRVMPELTVEERRRLLNRLRGERGGHHRPPPRGPVRD